MRNRARHLRRGAAVVELAILLPLIALMFAIGVDFSRAFYYTQIVESCARNGAAYLADPKAAAYNTYANVSAAALADASDLNPQPTVTSGSGTDSAGNAYVTCTVSWQFNTLTNFPGVPGFNISRTVQLRSAP